MNFQNILSKLTGGIVPQQIVRGTANPPNKGIQGRFMLKRPNLPDNAPVNEQAVQPSPTPAVLGSSTQAPPVTEAQIRRGWENYGSGDAPAATMSAVFADVANQYPRLRENPGLLPAMAMKESSGGKANTKNWFNWGLYDNHYQETNPEQVIRDVAEAIGSDTGNSSHYYQDFRESGDIMDMLNRYAPPTENDTNLYHKQLLEWMKLFQ